MTTPPDLSSGNEVRFTIAAVAQRTGLSVHTLRAWERRYGVPVPSRSTSKYRLYGPGDIDLIRRMQAGIADGASATEAARRARSGQTLVPPGTADPETLRGDLLAAFSRLDGEAVQMLMGRGETALGILGALEQVVIPVLHEIGDLWEAGTLGVDVEHFASTAVRGRLGGIAASMERGHGRIALLACPPGERHDLALVVLALRLLRDGWQPVLLGADLPLDALVAAVTRHLPDVVALSATSSHSLDAALATAAAVRVAAPARTRVLVGGQAMVAVTRLPAGVEGEAALAHILRGDPPAHLALS